MLAVIELERVELDPERLDESDEYVVVSAALVASPAIYRRLYLDRHFCPEGRNVAQLNVKLSQERLQALKRYAAQRRTPVAWLVKDYVDYLLAGGGPVRPPTPEPLDARELAEVAQRGGAFDWLAGEPDLYSHADGEPV